MGLTWGKTKRKGGKEQSCVGGKVFGLLVRSVGPRGGIPFCSGKQGGDGGRIKKNVGHFSREGAKHGGGCSGFQKNRGVDRDFSVWRQGGGE